MYGRILTALIITTFTDSLAEELLHPLLVLRLEAQDVPSSLIGLAISSGDLGILLAVPTVPLLLRFANPVVYLRASLSALCVGIFLFPLFPSVYAWIALDFAFGAVTCGYFILSDSLVNAASSEGSRGRLIAVYMLAESFGAIGGPLLLGSIGIEGLRPFAVASGIMLIGIVPWFVLDGVAVPDLGDDSRGSYRALARHAPLVLLLAAAAAFFEDVPATLLPLFSLDRGLDETAAVVILAVMATGSVALQFPVGWLADALDRRAFLAGLSAVSAVLCLALFGLAAHPLLQWGTPFLLGGAFNGFSLIALALLGQRAGPGQLAAWTAAATGVGSLASFAGPPVAGLLMDAIGAGALPIVLAGVAGAVGVSVLRSPKRYST